MRADAAVLPAPVRNGKLLRLVADALEKHGAPPSTLGVLLKVSELCTRRGQMRVASPGFLVPCVLVITTTGAYYRVRTVQTVRMLSI